MSHNKNVEFKSSENLKVRSETWCDRFEVTGSAVLAQSNCVNIFKIGLGE